VTEAITGLDLVEWQLRVSAGERLPDDWCSIVPHGHAIEARVYAENPARDYLPSVGRIKHLRWPDAEVGLRIDTGVAEGDEISSHYDPLIAKVIAHADSRDAAVARLERALGELRVAGVTTNAAFVGRILATPSFRNADLSTRLLEREPGLERPSQEAREYLRQAGALWLVTQVPPGGRSPWETREGWRLNLSPTQTLWLRDGEELVGVEVAITGDRRYTVGHGAGQRTVAVESGGADEMRLIADGRSVGVQAFVDGRCIHVWSQGDDATFEVAEPEGADPVEATLAGAWLHHYRAPS